MRTRTIRQYNLGTIGVYLFLISIFALIGFASLFSIPSYFTTMGELAKSPYMTLWWMAGENFFLSIMIGIIGGIAFEFYEDIKVKV